MGPFTHSSKVVVVLLALASAERRSIYTEEIVISEQKSVTCPVTMRHPFEEFKFSFRASSCFQCNGFRAWEVMQEQLFVQAEVCDDGADSGLCAAVKNKMRGRHCACGIDKGDKGVLTGLAFAGTKFNGQHECGPKACFEAFKYESYKEKSTDFDVDLYDVTATVQKCKKCSKDENAEGCGELHLGLHAHAHAVGTGGKKPKNGPDVWVAESDSEDEDVDEDELEAETPVAPQPDIEEDQPQDMPEPPEPDDEELGEETAVAPKPDIDEAPKSEIAKDALLNEFAKKTPIVAPRPRL
eukprot:gnl/TRDRNA2_/TRDRNA2_172814_c0_seq1.p1 gnl/TRDRNA2_/TRDRNA2_172814_c0~~gnl/TRDRNA2_/TRDRNA2_172814_c0_seq1.p1  ORF type:complete len:318 (-),score=78.51 gnl/TRDRNA2_/TRDRNA2_172814_c0_seq1:52-942(-)